MADVIVAGYAVDLMDLMIIRRKRRNENFIGTVNGRHMESTAAMIHMSFLCMGTGNLFQKKLCFTVAFLQGSRKLKFF